MLYNNPIAPERLEPILDLVDLSPGDRVLDLGCGTGELLITLGRRGIEGTGIDIDADALASARARAEGLPIHFAEGAASQIELPRDLALVVCLGATHAFASGDAALIATLSHVGGLLRPGGHVLIGEGYRRGPLPDPYRSILGEPTGIERTHLDNVACCEAHGFACVHAITASTAEWDAFEWGHFRRKRARIMATPEPGRSEALDRLHHWRDAYLRWGREVMGFGLYLLEA